ncbi:hypothetical protein [Dongia sp.]|uniref:hypothetical protein n=1 Tax=Dongia sp. TaxID=1977262 RepID=UPI0035B253C7
MVDDAWLAAALETTGDFETSGNPWAGVTGDFDGMGLSCGVLQWNIGSSSLQPLVIGAGRDAVMATMPKFGAAFWQACNGTKAAGMAIVRGWQMGARLKPEVKAELVFFLAGSAMVAQQMRAAGAVARRADKAAGQWAASRGTAPQAKRDFCWFFDLVTQNGGLKGVGLKEVNAFTAAAGNAEKAIGRICDHMATIPAAHAGFKDCWRNATLWRGTVPKEWRDLFILSFLRAQKSKPEFAGLVMNRKGAIAAGQGWVNGEQMNFEGRF